MGKRRITIKPGDVIEIPIGDGWLAYVRKYECVSYRPYRIVGKERRALKEVIASGFHDPGGFRDIVDVYEHLSETGDWPRVGKHPFDANEDAWGPPSIDGDRLYHRGEYRVATHDELQQIPPEKRFGENSFVDFLRAILLFAAPLERPSPEPTIVDPLANAMSVDKNDVAERAKLEFNDFVDRGCSPRKAIQKTIQYFADELDDTDFIPQFHLAMAALALKHKCLTKKLRDTALAVIASDECWDVAENVDKSNWHAAYDLRRQSVFPLKKALEEQNGL